MIIFNFFLLSRKYQFMEVSTTKRAGGLKEKIPDIQKTLATVQFLQKRKVRRSTMATFFYCSEIYIIIFTRYLEAASRTIGLIFRP